MSLSLRSFREPGTVRLVLSTIRPESDRLRPEYEILCFVSAALLADGCVLLSLSLTVESRLLCNGVESLWIELLSLAFESRLLC